jgi:hypothetical protein
MESVTFFFPSALKKTTDLDAIGLPTLVSFGPVLASLATSGKCSVTTLTGTTVLRGSKGGAASPHAANESSAIAATESTASAVLVVGSFSPSTRNNYGNSGNQNGVSYTQAAPSDNNGEESDRTMSKTAKEGKADDSPSQLIDAKIAALADWRGETLARVRVLIKEADPEMVEEVKWRKPSNLMLGVPVWSHAGIICTGETYKTVVKMTFAKGAALEDPSGLFNASLEGNTRRAIDFHKGDRIDETALKALIRAAVTLNTSTKPTA